MEQQRRSFGNSNMVYGREHEMDEKREEIPVHSQVKKIKQELNKITNLPPEMRPVLREITRQQISRSPLGLAGRPISVGDL